MLKYFLILGINIFLLYCVVLFVIDNRIFVKEPFAIIRNVLLLTGAMWICYNLVSIYVLKTQTPDDALVYKIASTAKSFTTTSYHFIKPFQKELIVWSSIAFGLIVLGFVTVGITGYTFLAIPVKLGLAQPISGDNAWPAALLMAFAWPLLLPVAVIVKHQFLKSDYASLANPGFWGFIVIGIMLLTTLIHLMYRVSK